jgi:hypothetical protein
MMMIRRGSIGKHGGNYAYPNNIWNDNWIPSSHNLKVQTPRGNILISIVDELINPLDGRWDEELIRSLFWPVDFYRILQIPIYNGRKDLIAWHPNWNGLLTVKSTYHCQWAHKLGSQSYSLAAGGLGSELIWKKLCKLSILGKVKIFAWRALHGCIPCHVTLANKYITNVMNCPVC